MGLKHSNNTFKAQLPPHTSLTREAEVEVDNATCGQEGGKFANERRHQCLKVFWLALLQPRKNEDTSSA